MKITAPRQSPEPAENVSKPAPKRHIDQPGHNHEEADAARPGRDFASVYAEVSRNDRHHHSDRDASGESDSGREAQGEGRTEREREAERRHAEQQGGGLGQRGGAAASLSPATLAEAAGARAILHIADLERIVAAVRTQIVAGGRREVTLEMQRSVLEGLSIKISRDEAGRLTAQFMTTSEQVKAQLDARAGELAELLRSRGLDLATLRTVVSSEADGRPGAEGRSASDSAIDSLLPTAVRKRATTQEDEVNGETVVPEVGGSTYRA